ncbi:MAG: hypothetical protein M3121_03635 [Chloroflexota bacterium]|nr:hypothetical protein [Chloroflexota bacterium]
MIERVQRQLHQIPGYSGYRAKERRRDDDRAVREGVAGDLQAIAADVESIARELANQRRLEQIQPIESLIRQIRLLADRVRTAPGGYAGLFSDREIDEYALDQLRRFDEQVQRELSTLNELVQNLKLPAGKQADLGPLLGSVNEEVDRLSTLWDTRGRVVDTARPAPEREVLALLEPVPPKAKSGPQLTIEPGDAVGIFEDHYIITSTLRLDAPPHMLLLARLDSSPRWLLSLTGEPTVSGLVTETTESNQPSGKPPIVGQGRATATDTTGTVAEAAVTFSLHAEDREGGTISLELDWGGERRGYHGKRIAPDDVESFGKPTV